MSSFLSPLVGSTVGDWCVSNVIVYLYKMGNNPQMSLGEILNDIIFLAKHVKEGWFIYFYPSSIFSV